MFTMWKCDDTRGELFDESCWSEEIVKENRRESFSKEGRRSTNNSHSSWMSRLWTQIHHREWKGTVEIGIIIIINDDDDEIKSSSDSNKPSATSTKTTKEFFFFFFFFDDDDKNNNKNDEKRKSSRDQENGDGRERHNNEITDIGNTKTRNERVSKGQVIFNVEKSNSRKFFETDGTFGQVPH